MNASRLKPSQAWKLAAALAVVVFLTACNGNGTATEDPVEEDPGESEATADPEEDVEPDEDATEDVEPDEDATGEPETSEVAVTALPILSAAPFFHAIESGIFEDEGLSVTHETGIGGPEFVPRLLAGELQFTWSGYFSVLLAASEGVDLVLVASMYSTDVGDGNMGVYAHPDAGIAVPADLEGATVAINARHGILEMLLTAALENAGVDPDTVEMVEVGFGSMPPALDRGEADAIFVTEPFGTQVKQELGAIPVVDPDGPPLLAAIPEFEDHPVVGFATTREFQEANPNTVAAFRRAMTRAQEEIAADPELGVQVVSGYLDLDEDLLSQVVWPSYTPLNLEAIQMHADMMYEYGYLNDPLDASNVVIAE